jgi:hypothetical protein
VNVTNARVCPTTGDKSGAFRDVRANLL